MCKSGIAETGRVLTGHWDGGLLRRNLPAWRNRITVDAACRQGRKGGKCRKQCDRLDHRLTVRVVSPTRPCTEGETLIPEGDTETPAYNEGSEHAARHKTHANR